MDRRISRRLAHIERQLLASEKREKITLADLTEITDAVTEISTVQDSAVELLNSLADQLEAASTDPAAIAALAAQLRNESSELAAAVVANTPAAPTEPTEPSGRGR